jgi:hypothetical protein
VAANTLKYGGVITPCGSCWNSETSKRDCATVVSYVFPSPRFAPHHTFLGDAVNAASRNSKERSCDLHDVMCNSTQRSVSCMSDSRVYGKDWRQFSSYKYNFARECYKSLQQSYQSQFWSEFSAESESYKWSDVEEESLSPWEDLQCDWNTFFVYNNWSVRLL